MKNLYSYKGFVLGFSILPLKVDSGSLFIPKFWKSGFWSVYLPRQTSDAGECFNNTVFNRTAAKYNTTLNFNCEGQDI